MNIEDCLSISFSWENKLVNIENVPLLSSLHFYTLSVSVIDIISANCKQTDHCIFLSNNNLIIGRKKAPIGAILPALCALLFLILLVHIAHLLK